MSVRLREEDDVLSNTYCDGPAGASVPQPNQPPRDRTSLLVRVVSFGIYHHQDSNGKQSDWGEQNGDDRRVDGQDGCKKAESNYNASTSQSHRLKVSGISSKKRIH